MTGTRDAPEKAVKVRDVMSSPPVTIDGLATAREAIVLMEKHDVSALVIDRRHEGDEYAIVTVRDIAEKVIGQNRSCDRTSIYELMTKPCVSLPAGMQIKYAIRLLTRFRLARAMVTENTDGRDVMVGFVSLRDMTLRYIHTREGEPEK